jgi:hypothetical protein
MKLLPMLGIAGGLGGAMALVRNVFNSTNAAGDKMAVMMGGLKTGTQAFFKTLATGDFGNFLTNIREAVKAGRDYVRVLDDVADRQLAASIQEAKSRIEIVENMKILRDETAEKEERIAAADRVLEIEKENAERRISIAKQAFDAELEMNATLAKADADKILNLIEEYDSYSDLISAADEYLALEKELFELQNAPTNVGSLSGMQSNKAAERQKEVEAAIAATDSATKNFIETYRGYLTLTDDQRKAIGKTATDLYSAQASFDEQTMATETRRGRLLNLMAKESGEVAGEEAASSFVDKFEVEWSDTLDYVREKQKELEDIMITPEDEIDEPEVQYVTELWRQTYEGRLAMLASYHKTGIIGITEYNAKKRAIEQEQANWEKANWQSQLQATANALGQIGDLLGKASATGKVLATGEAIINTYLGATMALTDKTIPNTFARIAAAIAVVVAGLKQVSAIHAVQFASGKYDVIGADDGRTYHAGVVKQAATGIYPEPTLVGGLGLVGERAPELVVDGPTLQNIQMNAPGIIEAINGMRVPQYAAGSYPQAPAPQMGTNISAALITELRRHGAILEGMSGKLDNPTRAKIVYSDMEDVQDEMDDIKDNFSK